MATLEPNSEQVVDAAIALLGFLNGNGIGADVGCYALSLATYIGCKNSLAMTDADYMRFCETIMTWGQPFLLVMQDATPPVAEG